MNYFWLRIDERISNGIVIGTLTKEELKGENPLIKKITLVRKAEPMIFQDYLTTYTIRGQYHIISDKLKTLFSLYNPNTEWMPIVMVDQFDAQYLYWFLTPEVIDCISKSTKFNFDRTVSELVLNSDMIKKENIFSVETNLQRIIVVRLDVAESILRRDFYGLRLRKIVMKEGD